MGNVINLSKWKLLNFGDWIGLSGIADKHPKLGSNITVSSTSEIVKVEYEEDGIDFRYYVGFKDITPYSWTENIEHVVIHNCKGHLITFNGARAEGIHIEPDETIVINRKDIIKDGEQLY